jgi:A/G-specific adenine glycosylase
VLGFGGDLASAREQQELWMQAEALLPADHIERYTQGLMDLGATVCTAKAPRCGDCPLQLPCAARREGRPEAYPVKTRRLARGRRESWLLWLQHRGRTWLVQRPDSGVWAGLTCLPAFDDMRALDALCERWPGEPGPLAPIEHALTHFDWMLHPVIWRWPEHESAERIESLEALAPGAWLTMREALARGLPAPIRRLFLEFQS